MQAFLRRKSMTRISDFRHVIPHCFHPMDPDEGASAWQRKRNGRGLVRPTTTDRPAASPSILAFGGLPKQSADSLLEHRVSLRSPPMTTNHGDDSNVGNRFQKLGSDFLNQRHFHLTWLTRTGNGQVPGTALTGTKCGGRSINLCLDIGANCRIDVRPNLETRPCTRLCFTPATRRTIRA
jgi:hypothetical protein